MNNIFNSEVITLFKLIDLKMKILFFSFCISLMVLSCKTNRTLSKKAKENLKDYAFCSCIIEGYKKDTVDIKDASIAVLYELSAYGIDLLKRKQIDSLTAAVINGMKVLQPGDYGNKKAIAFNCLQYYKGAMLGKLIKSMTVK